MEIDAFDLAQLTDPNGFFRFLQFNFSCEPIVIRIVKYSATQILKEIDCENINQKRTY